MHAPRNTVAVATCSLTILCFYCPVPYSTLLCLAELDQHFVSKMDKQRLCCLNQNAFNSKLIVYACSICYYNTLGKKSQSWILEFCSWEIEQGWTLAFSITTAGTNLQRILMVKVWGSGQHWFSSKTYFEEVKAAIKKARKGMYAKNRLFSDALHIPLTLSPCLILSLRHMPTSRSTTIVTVTDTKKWQHIRTSQIS